VAKAKETHGLSKIIRARHEAGNCIVLCPHCIAEERAAENINLGSILLDENGAILSRPFSFPYQEFKYNESASDFGEMEEREEDER
jgi:hypothetical protein